MRSYLVAAVILMCLWLTAPAFAQAAADPDTALEQLLKTLQAPAATEEARLLRTTEGYVRFIGAPPGGRFSTPAGAAKAVLGPDAAARDFIDTNSGVFGKGSLKQTFAAERVTSVGSLNYVRLQQKYSNFVVFGGQILVQMDGDNGVQCVSSDIMRDPGKLDSGEVSLSPAISTDLAKEHAASYVAGLYNVDVSGLTTYTNNSRMVFDPAVVGAQGELCTVLDVGVASTNGVAIVERVLVNVKNGAVAFSYPLVHNSKHRRIYDANSYYPSPNTIVREEGDPACGITDADNAYDYLGDTHDFYFLAHDRDSINGQGMIMRATVRYCEPGQCPMYNAFYQMALPPEYEEWFGMMGDAMFFGEDYVTDDVVAHEMTHGVTSYTSGLIYENQSGAINEAFSDIWGEFVDLVNGRGDDSLQVRWLHGEDLPYGPNRNMKDPTMFGDPDRVGSPYYYIGSEDYGGVHRNSGVINKLCYLLTDGDDFNGQSVMGMGIEKIAKLFYECQSNMLTAASDFDDLYMALGQATVNLSYTFEERLNVRAAARAVEIVPSGLDEELRLFRAVPAFTTRNRPVIALYWQIPNTHSLRQVILVRSVGMYARTPDEGYEIYRGNAEKFLDDTGITLGVTYYYSLFADVTEGFPSAVYARATAGGQPPDFLTEEFLNFEYPGYTLNPFDLNFSQILYSPTGPPSTSLGVTSPLGDYDNYTVTVRRSVYAFPVPRGDADNGSWEINLREDGGLWVGNTVEGIAMKHPFPFFQQTYSQVYLGANGYLAFEQVSDSDNRNYPSYSSHFAIPRISFLFANLAPKIGGEIWAKSLDDRFVVTFEDMPQWDSYIYPPSSSPNSVQVELFYSGHVRITYGAVNAYYAIVGLSDGRGVPINPALLFENLRSVSSMTDFSSIPSTPTALSIDPITPPEVEAGDVAEFTAHATAPISLGYPSLLAQWTLEDFPSFYDEGNGTGHFRWETNIEDYGEHIVRVSAFLADQTAYQDVRVWVNIEEPLPTATDLGIRTNYPVEDPTRSRTVSDETELIAMYTYTHPLQYILPEYYQEGYTQILWYQNQQIVPALANLPVVPPFYTHPNDQWCFQVQPVTVYGQQGMWATSPVVTILSLPEILDVVRVLDLPPGEIYPEQLPFPNVPVAWDLSSGGAEIAILGRKLSHVTCIKIGGIQCTSVESINDNRIDVIAPAHLPSPVVGGEPVPETVVVTTTSGTSSMLAAFVYVASGTAVSKADVNHDGVVDAVDVQLVINAVLMATKNDVDADVNLDGKVNSIDIQAVINEALRAT